MNDSCAVIMAGGKGIRLRPLTYKCPKPMVKVAGKPIIERIILRLREYQITNIYISINYLGKRIEDYFGDGHKFGVQIKYIKERKFLHTGGSLSLIKDNLETPTIVLNGDLVTKIDFGHFLRFHKKGRYSATIGVKSYTQEVPFGVIYKKGNNLSKLVEKPKTEHLINAGIYVLEPEVLKLIPKNTVFPITDLFAKLLKRNDRIGVYNMKEDWVDVGRIDELKKAEELLCLEASKKF